MPEAPVLLVTGTSKGIGQYLVKYFLQRGYQMAGCSRGESSLDIAGYFHVQADVADEGSVKTLVRTVREKFGRIDALINNAGIARMNLMMLTPAETADRIMSTNFRGTFLMSRECARIMVRQRSGRIVNFGTPAVPLESPGESVYAASKAAIVQLTKTMARELGPFGITCNVVSPGPTETELIRGMSEELRNELLSRHAIRRMGTFQDVANVVEFFLRPESSYVTGQVIYLGGP
jgi:3-oxoacyl-[acyl-carrier protein] reductase